MMHGQPNIKIRINAHKGKNTVTQYKQYKTLNTSTHINKTPTQM